MGPRPPLEPPKVIAVRFGWLLLGLAIPGVAWAHGSEYVYARLVLGEQPRLEFSLEYNDNPIVDSRDQAKAILERELLIHSGGRDSDLSGLADAVWGEAAEFPQTAPVPVPLPGDGQDHRLLTVAVALSGPFHLSLKKGSEQAVIYWVDDGTAAPPRWQILLAGDISPHVILP